MYEWMFMENALRSFVDRHLFLATPSWPYRGNTWMQKNYIQIKKFEIHVHHKPLPIYKIAFPFLPVFVSLYSLIFAVFFTWMLFCLYCLCIQMLVCPWLFVFLYLCLFVYSYLYTLIYLFLFFCLSVLGRFYLFASICLPLFVCCQAQFQL